MNADPEQLADGKVTLHPGDCLAVLPTLADNSVDAVCTDPPYELKFMGRAWDGTGVAFRPETWREVYRVLKPGVHLLAFGGTRTYHRLACAIEDAGFEVRDCVQWLYGSGFPKSHDVSKGIDRAAGAERSIIRTAKYRDIRNGHGRGLGEGINAASRDGPEYLEHAFTAPATAAARAWDGWGTSLKPAVEMIVLARKPLSESTVAANVLKWGTGALNIDGCRVGTTKNVPASAAKDRIDQIAKGDERGRTMNTSGFDPDVGRWPANVLHDGSDEVVAGFPESDHARGNTTPTKRGHSDLGWMSSGESPVDPGDSGSAARFFYTAKADSDDRLGSKHPTVKPLDLMQYLVRLITPPKGLVLDPFAGTGTTGEAAIREGMRAVLIEREAEYCEDIRRRMRLALAGPDERSREGIKARNLPRDDGPLFARREGETWDEMWARPFDYSKLNE